ncbi:DUF4260 domain-containing protein [Rouxiella badensis]|jgi:hypothetical protein|uniref:DUF4260 domain-containing protein n=1 Tax=Rouxiella badensis TaxID=1646377 RepID=A0A1X0WH52_9GAMM|nr:DUF4260 domain-containing protein [Rouxiella badensis]MCC3704994.1 DUF4260 domain-containing protein [Rouxiella badensis]MCC3721452.1 DUF4260 domain-containing protein [Rouxiella badensis]MCC3731017.1 DUF4260 domain-containing protein [Rouxiella badensis]MCC3735234.1 DUF4260 domain-containing protein [Rouxiella badensis]MCC3742328.1 DUF4260 domain-containing protein [Rouxiella badensis]
MQLQHLVIVRCENLLLLLSGLTLYWHFHFSWLYFCYFILVPDLAMVGYLFNNRAGAFLYNLTHNYVLPIILLAFYPLYPQVLMLALIWIVHIGFDRALGYGLKSPQGFKKTHLLSE